MGRRSGFGGGSSLYKAARVARTTQQVARGRGFNRARNIAVGRTVAKAGLFRRLWK